MRIKSVDNLQASIRTKYLNISIQGYIAKKCYQW